MQKYPTFIARRGNLILWSLGDYEYEITYTTAGFLKMKDTDLDDALKTLAQRAAEEEE